jgi:hypothetical protein
MSRFIPLYSQPLEAWADTHAPGTTVDLGGHRTHHVYKGGGPSVLLIHGFNYDLDRPAANPDSGKTDG